MPAAKSFTVALPVSVDSESYTLQAILTYNPPVPNPPALYAVKVNNGTGSGNYAPGATVTITADAPDPGYAFTGWTVVSGGVTPASSSSETTTFTMPANPVEVTATYALTTYAVTVNNGTGSGSYAPGATVSITANTPDPGYAFAGWTVVSGGVTLASSSSAATTFTMPASPVAVTATYALTTYAVTVNNGTGGGNYAPGATVSITANTPTPGDAFTGWTVVSGGVTLNSASSMTTTFTMPASPVAVTATYALTTYAVTVNNGTGDGNYAPGTTVTITANTPAPGHAFTGWTVVSGGVTLASSSSVATTFTMPASPVEVTATYALITYAVTVNNGTGSGNYAPGATVSITADTPTPGDAFTGWTVISGGVTLNSASSMTTTFTMPASPVEVTATYELITYAVTVNDGTGGGNYAPGATVSITANTPDPGYAFAGWTVVSGGVTLASSSSAATTFTMPANPVEVTATYALTTYAVTVNNGTGSGSYAPGATVSITANTPDPGYAFAGWTVVSGGVTLASSSSAATTFTMPASPVAVTATYALTTYAVTVNNGTGGGNYAPGATVSITANTPTPGDAFAGWTVVSGGVTLASSSSAATTFTMPASPVAVTATYALTTYAVTVNNGTGGGNYAPGATVNITADTPTPGDAFTGWTVISGGVTLNSASSMTTTFTMPASPVAVTATYALTTYAVTVNNGTGDGNYAPGATVNITADTPTPGDAFTGWTVISGGVTLASSSSAATTFTMPASPVEVTATYALTTYAVTVNNGIGGGNYAPGATVSITANTPTPGDAFTGWTVVSGGVTLNSASSMTTTFTMPASPVEVTATYELITYAVTVNNGIGGGNYAPGATVSITANTPTPGDAFTGWTVVSGGVTLASSSSAATTFTMPASPVEVTATYELITYAVTVNNGTGGGNYAPGATVNITADTPDPGYAFTGWTVISGGVTLNSALSAATTFTMPASPVEVTATYELITYAVTVNNGTGGGNYAPGATVNITADTPDPGYAFTGWTVVSGGVTLNSALSAATTFTMPASPVEVTATYALITYAVTVNKGTGGGIYAPGATVNITADTPDPGYVFAGWTVVSGGMTLNSALSTATTFTMPANPVEVTATYVRTLDFSSGGNATMTTVIGGLLNQGAVIGGDAAASATVYPLQMNLSGNADALAQAQTIPENMILTGWNTTFTIQNSLMLIGTTITVYADIYIAPSGSDEFSRAGTLTLTPSLTGLVPPGYVVLGSVSGLNIPISAGDRVILVCHGKVESGIDLPTTFTGTVTAQATLKK